MDWSSGNKSGRVSINSHHLFLRVSGPDRKPDDVVAIIIQGLSSSSRSWAAVERLLNPVIRTYVYDRSGYGESDSSPQKPTSAAIVEELDLLLESANIHGPFILVGHSWGGILGREFFHRRPEDVAGLVLVDANQERTMEVIDWRNPAIGAVTAGVDYLDAVGIRRDHKLTDEEWAIYLKDVATSKHSKQAEAEMAEYPASFPVMASKSQLHQNPRILGDRPVCLVLGNTARDFEGLYEAGVKAGGGSEEDRAVFRGLLETWDEKDKELQLECLSLSSNTRSFVAEDSGHQVQFTNPEVIVEGVKWVLSQLRGQSDL